MVYRTILGMWWIFLISGFLIFPATARAQAADPLGGFIIVKLIGELHKVADISVGFSMANTTNTLDSSRKIPMGIHLGFSGHSGISAEVDFAGQSTPADERRRKIQMFQYLFGPRFSAGSGRTTVYSHVLAGGIYQSEERKGYMSSDEVFIPGESFYKGSGFAMALGGGLDVNVNNKFAVRVAQFDWIPIRQDGTWITNTMRFGCGVVIRAGE